MSELVLKQGSYVRSHDGPGERDSARPRFYMGTRQDHAASEAAGRPIYHEIEMVEVFLPANIYNRPHLLVTDMEKGRWPTEYEQFRKGQEQSGDGTPLEQWSILNRSQVLELKAIGFGTIEDLAQAGDATLGRLGMGGRRIRDLAKAYMEQSEGMAPLTKMAAENEKLRDQAEQQGYQIRELNELLSKLSAQVEGLGRERPAVDPNPAPTQPALMAPAASSLDSLVSERPKKGKAA